MMESRTSSSSKKVKAAGPGGPAAFVVSRLPHRDAADSILLGVKCKEINGRPSGLAAKRSPALLHAFPLFMQRIPNKVVFRFGFRKMEMRLRCSETKRRAVPETARKWIKVAETKRLRPIVILAKEENI